jgi:uncharacterized protein DUF4375
MNAVEVTPPSESDEDLMSRAADYAYAKLHQCNDDVARLEIPLQTLAIIYSAQAIVDNGGFRYFFGNDFPHSPPYSLTSDAYRRIGAVAGAELIDRAVDLFPFPNPHLHGEARKGFMKALPEDHLLFELGNTLCGDESVWNLLAEYVRKHVKAFQAVH